MTYAVHAASPAMSSIRDRWLERCCHHSHPNSAAPIRQKVLVTRIPPCRLPRIFSRVAIRCPGEWDYGRWSADEFDRYALARRQGACCNSRSHGADGHPHRKIGIWNGHLLVCCEAQCAPSRDVCCLTAAEVDGVAPPLAVNLWIGHNREGRLVIDCQRLYKLRAVHLEVGLNRATRGIDCPGCLDESGGSISAENDDRSRRLRLESESGELVLVSKMRVILRD